MKRVKLTVTEANCRSGHFSVGDEFIVDDLCPPICHELWSVAYPYVFALQNGAVLDCGEDRKCVFSASCPDGGRVKIRGELLDE